jgi:adenosylcobinamide-GDP ribazoletransferase
MRDALALLTTLGRRGGTISARSAPWFPVVGLGLGGALGAWWWLAEQWWPAGLAAVLVLVADLALTGMLHMDGLTDAADGLLPHASAERRLAIMRAADIGAFGAVTVAVVLLARAFALASMTPSIALLAALWCTSRSLVASVPSVVPYARDSGIATALITRAPRWPVLVAAPALALAAADSGMAGAAAVLGALLAGAGMVGLGWRRLGGFTGDVLGAAIVIGETVGLVIGAAKW